MSKIVKVVEGRKYSHFVKTCRGNIYYVDSSNTFDRGYETMVFPANDKFEVTSWSEKAVKWYNTEEEMRNGHNDFVRNMEDYLN